MMKRIIPLLVALLPMFLAAQVTISVQLPPAGMVPRDQLWNLVLVNNGNIPKQVNVLLNLQDAVTGQVVLTAVTRSFTLSKGLRLLNIQDIQPVQYNNTSGPVNNNFLPLGSYIACYTVMDNDVNDGAPLADECLRLTILPLSPPLLNTPADKVVLNQAYPQFNWLPPTPVEMFDDLNYEISVVEVLPDQSPGEAILYNVPLYTSAQLASPFNIYPSTYRKLETGKIYAWQVTAKNGLNYAATTEVWTFSIGKDSTKVEAVTDGYIQMSTNGQSHGVSMIQEETLNIKFYSADDAFETTVRFKDDAGQIIDERRQKIGYGDNFIKLPLSRKFQNGKEYLVELSNRKDQILSARFSIK